MFSTNRSIGRRPGSLALDLILQAALCFVCMAAVLRLWNTDLRVPFNYWGDTIFQLALVKSIADGGWIWFIERLGAPFGLDIVAFPQNLTTSSLAMKAISFFTDEPGLILNLYWLCSIVLTSVTCHVSLRSLDISRPTSLVVSVLYALMPYAWFRNTAHISLIYVFVPPLAAYAVEILAHKNGIPSTNTVRKGLPKSLVYVAAICVGFDYIYNSFFASFFLATSGLMVLFCRRSCIGFYRVAPLLLLIAACAFTNLLPSLLHWKQYGQPPRMDYKEPAAAEILGLKLRHVVSPMSTDVLDRPGFPNENENQFSKLGAVGAVGFVLALLQGLSGRRRGERQRMMWGAGVLTYAGLLLATVGGFGAIFNTLVTPDIRAYARIIVFMGFFAFFVLACWLDTTREWSFRRLQAIPLGARAPLASITLVVVLLLGLADQGVAADPLRLRHHADREQMLEERTLVGEIEAKSSAITSLYQLPKTGFPPDGGMNGMTTYDHGRPYLWSRRLQWSWPNFSQRYETWERSLPAPGTRAFTSALVVSGFSGIWLDRSGYKGEELQDLEYQLQSELGLPWAESASKRYAVYSLEQTQAFWQAGKNKHEIALERAQLLDPIKIAFLDGFYHEESHPNGQDFFRWATAHSQVELSNPSNYSRRGKLRFQIGSTPKNQIKVNTGTSVQIHTIEKTIEPFELEMNLPPNSKTITTFSMTGKKIEAPGDPRDLYFSIINPKFKEEIN